MKESIEYRKQLNEERVWKYNNDLCNNITDYITNRWNVSLISSRDMTSSMITIEIPCLKKLCYDWDINLMNQIMINKYKIFGFIAEYKNKRYVRLSCNIYNEFREFLLYFTFLESEIKLF
jgi:hypothetical protein